MKLLRRIIIFLVKIGLIKKPKTHTYAVEARVLIDGKLIKQFPVETQAYSRRMAKVISINRLGVKAGTTAINLGNCFEVPLKIYVDGLLKHQTSIRIKAINRRAAKFEVTKRLKLQTGSCARKDHLIKYNKNSI